MIKTVLLTVGLVLVAVLLLGCRVLFVKGGKFPSGHVHDIPELKKRNITCGKNE